MSAPVLLTNNWTHRVMFNPEKPAPHVESFFIKANDPKHDRALWVRLTLTSDGKETYGEAWAIVFDRAQKRYLAAKERYPLSRVLIDPERPGMGVGPCSIVEGHTWGVVNGDGFSVSWDLKLNDELPPYQAFPSERLYKSPLIKSKIVTPNPSAAVNGKIEIWEAKSRHAEKEVIRLENWRGMHGHNWGVQHNEDYAWTHCNSFVEQKTGAFFEAFSARPKIGFLQPQVTLGRLVLGDKTYRFDTWQNFTGQKSEHTPLSFKFTMTGPDGRLQGEVSSDQADTVGLVYKNPGRPDLNVLNSKLAKLTLTLTPKNGVPQTLTSHKAALEVAGLQKTSGLAAELA